VKRFYTIKTGKKSIINQKNEGVKIKIKKTSILPINKKTNENYI